MVARSRARYLAPAALIAAVVAVVIVVADSGRSTPQPAPSRTVITGTKVLTRRHHPRQRRFYVVRPGDNLSIISARTGVPLSTLQALNPGVDPAALQTGQRLRLRR